MKKETKKKYLEAIAEYIKAGKVDISLVELHACRTIEFKIEINNWKSDFKHLPTPEEVIARLEKQTLEGKDTFIHKSNWKEVNRVSGDINNLSKHPYNHLPGDRQFVGRSLSLLKCLYHDYLNEAKKFSELQELCEAEVYQEAALEILKTMKEVKKLQQFEVNRK